MRARLLLPLALVLVLVPHVAGVTTDAQLIQRVENEYPGIINADDWTKVRILREFSYRHTAYATNVSTQGYAAGEQNITNVYNGTTTL